MKSNSRWKNHGVWLCLNHLPAVRYRSGQIKCWYAGCETSRPNMEGRPEPAPEKPAPPPRVRVRPRRPRVRPAVPPPSVRVVAPTTASDSGSAQLADLSGENEENEAFFMAEVDFAPGDKCAWPPCAKRKRPRSKYCSRNCSNKFARHRHRQRRKDE